MYVLSMEQVIIRILFATRIIAVMIIAALFFARQVQGVDYGGEKSFLFSIPYQVCSEAPLPEDAEKAGIRPVNTLQAKQLYDGGAYFYDARTVSDYSSEHIAGASQVVFDNSKGNYTVLKLPQNHNVPIVFYCYGESCANSYEAALAVRTYGYNHVYWLMQGYAPWKRKGYPVD